MTQKILTVSKSRARANTHSLKDVTWNDKLETFPEKLYPSYAPQSETLKKTGGDIHKALYQLNDRPHLFFERKMAERALTEFNLLDKMFAEFEMQDRIKTREINAQVRQIKQIERDLKGTA